MAAAQHCYSARDRFRSRALICSWVYAALGRKEAALEEGRRAIALVPVEKDVIDGSRVIQYFAILSIPVSHAASIALLKIDPVCDPIRNRSDFQQLLSGTEEIGPNR